MSSTDEIQGVGGDPERPPHEHTRFWDVHAEDVEGNFDATIGQTTITNEIGWVATVQVYISPTDGALVVQIEPFSEQPTHIRVNIADALAPAYEETVTP